MWGRWPQRNTVSMGNMDCLTIYFPCLLLGILSFGLWLFSCPTVKIEFVFRYIDCIYWILQQASEHDCSRHLDTPVGNWRRSRKGDLISDSDPLFCCCMLVGLGWNVAYRYSTGQANLPDNTMIKCMDFTPQTGNYFCSDDLSGGLASFDCRISLFPPSALPAFHPLPLIPPLPLPFPHPWYSVQCMVIVIAWTL